MVFDIIFYARNFLGIRRNVMCVPNDIFYYSVCSEWPHVNVSCALASCGSALFFLFGTLLRHLKVESRPPMLVHRKKCTTVLGLRFAHFWSKKSAPLHVAHSNGMKIRQWWLWPSEAAISLPTQWSLLHTSHHSSNDKHRKSTRQSVSISPSLLCWNYRNKKDEFRIWATLCLVLLMKTLFYMASPQLRKIAENYKRALSIKSIYCSWQTCIV